MRNSFVKAIAELAESDSRITLITGDLGFGVLTEFAKRFPKQFFNAGVAEQNMTGLATGLALEGRIVYTYSIANFSTLRCLEQIRNDAAYHGCNVNVVAIGGGFSYGQLGFSHHATEDLAIMRALPEVTVFSPGDPWEAYHVTKSMAQTPGTSYIRLDRGGAKITAAQTETFTPGKIRTAREGKDFSVLATGGILEVALTVAEKLNMRGISIRVLSAHTLRPFDQETLFKAAQETNGLITLEEHTISGGLGSLSAETLLEGMVIPKKFYRMGLRSGFTTIVGDQSYLRDYYGMGESQLTEKILEMLG